MAKKIVNNDPKWRFFVYPFGKTLRVEVCVFDSRRKMRAYYREVNEDTVNGGRAAWDGMAEDIEIYHFKDGKQRRDKTFGRLYIYKNALNMKVITHEAVHLGMRYCERKYKDFSMENYKTSTAKSNIMDIDCPEERLAYAVGEIAGRINSKCWKLKIFK